MRRCRAPVVVLSVPDHDVIEVDPASVVSTHTPDGADEDLADTQLTVVELAQVNGLTESRRLDVTAHLREGRDAIGAAGRGLPFDLQRESSRAVSRHRHHRRRRRRRPVRIPIPGGRALRRCPAEWGS